MWGPEQGHSYLSLSPIPSMSNSSCYKQDEFPAKVTSSSVFCLQEGYHYPLPGEPRAWKSSTTKAAFQLLHTSRIFPHLALSYSPVTALTCAWMNFLASWVDLSSSLHMATPAVFPHALPYLKLFRGSPCQQVKSKLLSPTHTFLYNSNCPPPLPPRL